MRRDVTTRRRRGRARVSEARSVGVCCGGVCFGGVCFVVKNELFVFVQVMRVAAFAGPRREYHNHGPSVLSRGLSGNVRRLTRGRLREPGTFGRGGFHPRRPVASEERRSRLFLTHVQKMWLGPFMSERLSAAKCRAAQLAMPLSFAQSSLNPRAVSSSTMHSSFPVLCARIWTWHARSR